MARSLSPLRRLSVALGRGRNRWRTTDWWTVFIEIGVVVLGILIAFELDDWGDSRQRQKDEQLVLQRLEEEAAGDYRAVHRIWLQHRESKQNYRLLARAVSDPVAHAAYHRQGAVGCNLLRLPAVRRASASLGALGAGERLELINDAPLRALLRTADAERSFADSQLAPFRDSFQRYAPTTERHMRWRFTPQSESCGVDIDTLRSDREAIVLLPKLARDQRQFATYRAREGVAVQKVLRRVHCLRRASCEAERL